MSHVSFQTRVHVVSVLKQGSLFDLTMKIILPPHNQGLAANILNNCLHHVKSMRAIFPSKVERNVELYHYFSILPARMFLKSIAIEGEIR